MPALWHAGPGRQFDAGRSIAGPPRRTVTAPLFREPQ